MTYIVYIHGGAIFLRYVRCLEILDEKVIALEAAEVEEWEAVQEIYEQFGGIREGARFKHRCHSQPRCSLM